MAENRNLIIIIAIAAFIVMSISAILYINLPSDVETIDSEDTKETSETNENNSTNTTENQETYETILTITFNDIENTYTVMDLSQLNPLTLQGRSINVEKLPEVKLSDPINYTGISMKILLKEVQGLPETFNLTITSSDEISLTYSKDTVFGDVDVYGENGSIIEAAAPIMFLAYAEEGVNYSESDPDNKGPLSVVFVGHSNQITSSDLWESKITSIEIQP